MANFDIRNVFGFHRATEVSGPLHKDVRARFLDLALWIDSELPEGREKSLCLTTLQEAQMWANASVAINLAPLVDE